MARQSSFGDTLRQARERKGLDLATAARKLRIRPDILRAIEDGDFARMPPRGYTSNMVGAYARLVGLNPTEATRAYRDEAYQFETGRRPMGSRAERGQAHGHAGMAGEGRRAGRSSQRDTYADATARSQHPGRSGERRRRNAAPPSGYTNLVQGRQAPGITANFGSMLPLIGVGAVILILLIVVLFFAFGNGKGAPADDTPSIPISGMPNPSGTDAGNGSAPTDQGAAAPTVQPVAPTVAKFTYKVADGKEVYLEVKVDGKTKEAANVTGPKEMSYDVADELKFTLSGDPADVALTVDGKTVEPTEAKSGVYVYKMTFAEFLEEWKRENGVDGGTSSGDGQADGASAQSDESSSDGSGDSGDGKSSGSSEGGTSSSDN